MKTPKDFRLAMGLVAVVWLVMRGRVADAEVFVAEERAKAARLLERAILLRAEAKKAQDEATRARLLAEAARLELEGLRKSRKP